jgi:hypothetical protein
MFLDLTLLSWIDTPNSLSEKYTQTLTLSEKYTQNAFFPRSVFPQKTLFSRRSNAKRSFREVSQNALFREARKTLFPRSARENTLS